MSGDRGTDTGSSTPADSGGPMLRSGVTVDSPVREGDPWIISLDGVPRARVGAEIAARVSLLPTQLHRSSPPRGEVDDTDEPAASAIPLDDELVSALRNAGLLVKDRPADALTASPRSQLLSALTGRGRGARVRSKTSRRPGGGAPFGSRDGVPGRLAFRPPMSLQLTLVDPSRTAALVARAIGSAVRLRRVLIVAILVVLCGGAAAAFVAADLVAVVDSPLPMAAVLAVVAGALAASFVHEWSHAVALAAAGGRPTRLGVMIFYLSPAFFCDVTDGWRIGDRGRRAGVALAGPALHLVLAAFCAIALLLLRIVGSGSGIGIGDSTVAVALALCCVTFTATTLANLLPFIALDGYLALVALVDEPHLRAHTMTESGQALVRALGGDVRLPRTTSRRRIAFGVCCTLFPFVLIGSTLGRLAPALVASGTIGAAMLLLLDVAVLGVLVRRLTTLGRALREGRARARRVLPAAVGLVAVLIAVAAAPVPRTMVAGFVRAGSGVDLVIRSGGGFGTVPDGVGVTLQQNGVVLHPAIGRARITDGATRTPTSAPGEAFLPIRIDGLAVAATSIPLDESGHEDANNRTVLAGRAVIDLGGSEPLGMTVVEGLVVAPIMSIRSLLTTETRTP